LHEVDFEHSKQLLLQGKQDLTFESKYEPLEHEMQSVPAALNTPFMHEH